MEQRVYNRYNIPRGKPVKSGNEIYKWQYLNDKGELCEEQKNVKEEINSFLPMVDYKKQIARGEISLNEGATSELRQDFTNLPDNTVGIVELINKLSTLSQDEISYYMEQVGKKPQETLQTKQEPIKEPVSTGEVTKQVGEVQSTVSETTSPSSTGGK